MLKELHITGFALIEELQLSFYSGFSVLTGETGAGKSIIIDALSLLLGERASTEMIRTGHDFARVEGVFSVTSSAKQVLEGWGFSLDDEILLEREIHHNGRSKCRINGQIVLVSQLAELAPYLVNILGQNDNQYLTDSSNYLKILDAFGNQELTSLKMQVAKEYATYQKVKKQRLDLQRDERDRLARIDLLQFQIDEIKQANIRVGEEANLRILRDRLGNVERLTTTAEAVYSLLQDSLDERPSLYDLLADAVGQLSGLEKYDMSLSDLVKLLNSALVNVDEGSRELRQYIESFDRDPQALEQTEQRLLLIRNLQRKYGESEQDILDHYTKSQTELETLLNSSQTIDHLLAEESQLLATLTKLSSQLTAKRQECAMRLKKDIELHLADLNMDKTRFQVEISIKEIGSDGSDQIDFLISPNIGEDLKPLAKVASGGEMSRIMLALQCSFARADVVSTLIFDEIDAGVGGITAQKIASKLRKLGESFQLVSITHLPVVASYAANHYYIDKQTHDGRTTTIVTLLDQQGRIHELIRMLGGHDNQEITVAHAKELLKQAATR